MALRLRFAEEPLRLAYSLIGHGGRESGSFLSFYRMQQRLAEAIDNMPDTCHAVKGLRQKLRIAAKTVYTRAEETFEAMLVTPAHVAQRMKVFLPGGDALDAMNEVERHVTKVQQDIRDGLYGLQVDASQPTAEDVSDEPAPKKPRLGELEPQKRWWGDATSLGISVSEDGKRLVFGNVLAEYAEAPDLSQLCAATVAAARLGPRVDARHSVGTQPGRALRAARQCCGGAVRARCDWRRRRRLRLPAGAIQAA